MSKNKWDEDEPVSMCRYGKIEMMAQADGTVSLCVLAVKDNDAFDNLDSDEALAFSLARLTVSPFATVHLRLEEVEDLVEELQDYIKWRKTNNEQS